MIATIMIAAMRTIMFSAIVEEKKIFAPTKNHAFPFSWIGMIISGIGCALQTRLAVELSYLESGPLTLKQSSQLFIALD